MVSSTEHKAASRQVERNGIEQVTDDQRHGKPHTLFHIWVSTNLTVGAFVTGSLAVSLGLGLYAALIAVTLGALMGAVLIPVMSRIGWEVGIPQMLMTRPVFGRLGAIPPIAMSWVSFLGWFTVLDVLGAKALSVGFGLPMVPGICLISLASITLGAMGNDSIQAAEKWIARLAGIVLVAIALVALPQVDWSYPGNTDLKGADWWGIFALVIAIAFSYAGPGYTPYASDYTRYLPRHIRFSQIFTPTFLGMSGSCIFVFMLGAMVLSIAPKADVLETVVTIMGPFAKVAMAAFALGSVAANAMNVYSGGLTALASGVKINRWVSAIIIGLVGTVLAVWAKEQFIDKYEGYLLLVLYVVPAMDAIFIVDYFFVKKGRYSAADFYGAGSPLFNTKGWAAYLIGVLASVPMISSTLYVGPIAQWLHGADISYVVSMLVSGSVYWALQSTAASKAKAVASTGISS